MSERLYWDQDTHGLRSVPTRHGWHVELVRATAYDTLVIDCNTLRAANEGLRETNREQREERDALVAALAEALEYLDDCADVVDGDYGEPAPNKAMLVAQSLRAALKAQP